MNDFVMFKQKPSDKKKHETRVKEVIAEMGTKYRLHPDNYVKKLRRPLN
jgi:hypothetical protein